MKVTNTTRKIISNYTHENIGVRSNLMKILGHGKLGGTGRMIILPVDQGFEHGPDRSFAVNSSGVRSKLSSPTCNRCWFICLCCSSWFTSNKFWEL